MIINNALCLSIQNNDDIISSPKLKSLLVNTLNKNAIIKSGSKSSFFTGINIDSEESEIDKMDIDLVLTGSEKEQEPISEPLFARAINQIQTDIPQQPKTEHSSALDSDEEYIWMRGNSSKLFY